MTLKHSVVGAAAALALTALSASVQAAPPAAEPHSLKAVADENTALQDIVWVRRCWRHNGYRHCRRVWSDTPYYYESYPYDDGYYYGPSIGFSFGGGHGHHHSGHHHGGHHHR
jgi:hypothetical protein